MDSRRTRETIEGLFANIGKGNMKAVFETLSPSIVFELPRNEWNAVIPYLGTHRGHAAVAEAFRIRSEETEVQAYEVRSLVVEGERSCAVLYTKAMQIRTKIAFEIEDSHHLIVDDRGRVSHWKVYFDPNCEVAAFKGNYPKSPIG
jgi:ketosteroid isomerase-like protein